MALCGGVCQKGHAKIFFVPVIFSVLMLLVYIQETKLLFWNYASDDVEPNLHLSNTTKLILTWSTWFGSKNLFNHSDDRMGDVPFQSKHCPYKDCFLSSDKSNIKRTDLVLFHFADSFQWPRKRYSHQYYAHFTHEPSGNRKPHARTFLDKYEGYINVTINYRRDADLFVPYLKLVRKNTSNPPYKPRTPFANKNKMALWPVSNCNANSKRQDYIKELRKYMSVDIYGKCGSHTCSRSISNDCLRQWENNYKFYIAFENNICEDYITEKMFLPLRYEMIPVVLGGGNYSRDAPPQSVINARDFNSPKALAEFLIRLAEDEQRYYSYFNWKSQFEEIGGTTMFFCKLCEALHTNKFPQRPASTHYADYWFGPNGEKCDNGLIPRMRKDGGW